MSDPTCKTCGQPRSVGCEDPDFCDMIALGQIDSVDPAAMAELMATEEDDE